MRRSWPSRPAERRRQVRSSLIAAALLLAACGPERPAAVRTTSSPKPPAWLAKSPSSSDTLYFSGAKEGASSLEEGKASALDAARSQAAQYIGVEISAEHHDVMSTEEADNMARDTVKSRANAMLRAPELADLYYEQLAREDGPRPVDP